MLPDSEKGGSFSSYRMLPPGKCNFYFMTQDNVIIADSYDSEEFKLIDEDK